MTPGTSIRVVAFDLMDTLVRDPFRDALVAATGCDLEKLFALRDANAYPAFECGEIDESTYWASYPKAGIDVDPDRFHEVRRAETTWLPGMRELLVELADAEVITAVASNYPHWLAEHEGGILAGVVDVVVGSYQLGARKPDPAFFSGLLDVLDERPAAVVFVDDRDANLDAAARAGLPTVRAGTARAVRAGLVTLGVMPA